MRGCLGQLILIGVITLIVGGIALKGSIESYWRANDIVEIEAEKTRLVAAQVADQKAKDAAQEVALFDSTIAEYASEKWDTAKTISKNREPVQKIVIVDVATKKKDGLQSSLPEHIQAIKKDEINAVALIRRGQERVGSYTDGSGAMRRTVSVSIFRTNGTRLCAAKTFRGSEPPTRKSGSGSAFGDEPQSEVINYVKSCSVGAR